MPKTPKTIKKQQTRVSSPRNTRSGTRLSSRATKPPDHFLPSFDSRQADDAEHQQETPRQENDASKKLKHPLSGPATGAGESPANLGSHNRGMASLSVRKSPRTKRMLPSSGPHGAIVHTTPPNTTQSNNSQSSKTHSIPPESAETTKPGGESEETLSESTTKAVVTSAQRKRKKRRIRVIPLSLQPKRKPKTHIQSSSPSTEISTTVDTKTPSSLKANQSQRKAIVSEPPNRLPMTSPPRNKQKLTSKASATTSNKNPILNSEPTSPLVQSTSQDKVSLKLKQCQTTTTSSKRSTSCRNSKQKSVSPRRQRLLSATSVLELTYFDEQAKTTGAVKPRKMRKDKGVKRKKQQQQPTATQSQGKDTVPAKKQQKIQNDKNVSLKPYVSASNAGAVCSSSAAVAVADAVSTTTEKPQRKPRSHKGVARGANRKSLKDAAKGGSAVAKAESKSASGADLTNTSSAVGAASANDNEVTPTEPDADPQPNNNDSTKPNESKKITKSGRKPRKDKGVPRGPRNANSKTKSSKSVVDATKKDNIECKRSFREEGDALTEPTCSEPPVESTEPAKHNKLPKKHGRKTRKDKGVPRGPRAKNGSDEPGIPGEQEKEVLDTKKSASIARKDKQGVPRGLQPQKESGADDDDTATKATAQVKNAETKERKTRREKGKRRIVGFYAGARCGDCLGCRVIQNCGKCIPCLDMPEFGGPGKLRKLCILRKCLKSSRAAGRKNDSGAVDSAKESERSAIKGSRPEETYPDMDGVKNVYDSNTECESLSDHDVAYVEEVSDMEWDDNRPGPDPVPIMKAGRNGAMRRSFNVAATGGSAGSTSKINNVSKDSMDNRKPEAVSAAELARRLQEKQRAEANGYGEDEEDSSTDEEDWDDLFMPPPPPPVCK